MTKHIRVERVYSADRRAATMWQGHLLREPQTSNQNQKKTQSYVSSSVAQDLKSANLRLLATLHYQRSSQNARSHQRAESSLDLLHRVVNKKLVQHSPQKAEVRCPQRGYDCYAVVLA